MSNEIKLPVWRCIECNSSNVEQLAWVQLNTTNPSITFFESSDREEYWCNQCQEHTKLKIDEKAE